MKNLDELGISPTPWSYDGGVLHDADYSEIVSGCEDGFGGSCVDMQDSDGRLIAAAPDLYNALCRMLDLFRHTFDERSEPEKISYAGMIRNAITESERALAKAAGEEVSK